MVNVILASLKEAGVRQEQEQQNHFNIKNNKMHAKIPFKSSIFYANQRGH